ncbi:hypothetical protein BDV34DRAFT_140802 [Aspergillus parasiticus]|uniref:Uncharacterized protein n=1 Tax=Aspergillus parasiticus TaxID=5067 RepID=A0A5N6E0V3_ASPPA|nr:hypothetical protein BDV34DRAFT_140802 [Aspergillus parasiticus]
MLCSIEDERLISFMVFFSFILSHLTPPSPPVYPVVDKLIRYRFCLHFLLSIYYLCLSCRDAIAFLSLERLDLPFQILSQMMMRSAVIGFFFFSFTFRVCVLSYQRPW